MSLINQMLQDLDARGQSTGAGASIPSQVRAVLRRSGPSKRWLLLGLVLMVAAGAGGWYWIKIRPLAVRMPAPLDAPVRAAALPAVAPPVTSATVAPAASADSQFGLKISPNLSLTNEASPKSLPAPRPAAVAAPKVRAPAAEGQTLVPPLPAPVARAKRPEPEESVKTTHNNPAALPQKNVKELSEQQRAENEYRNAATLIQQGKNAEAMRSLEQAVYLDPLHGAARLTLVSLLIEVKQQNAAIRRLKEGLSLEPSQAGMAMALARLQVEKGELRQAVEVLEHTLPYTGERADYQAFLAALLQRQGRNKEAAEHFIVALRNAPQSGVWWMGLGISLQADTRNAEALEAFLRAKSCNTLSPELSSFVDQKVAQLRR